MEREFNEFKALVREEFADLRATIGLLEDKVEKLQSTDEKRYQKLLEDRFQASHLHIPGVGITDITTDDTHIEIKRWSRYHEVPGQLAKYQHAIPRDKLAVYFFGRPPAVNKKYHSILHMTVSFGIETHSIDKDDNIVTHAMPPSTKADTGRVRFRNLTLHDWLRSNLSHEDGGRVHLHRLPVAFKKFLNRAGSGEEIPSTNGFKRALVELDYSVETDRALRQRDSSCEVCKNSGMLIKDAKLIKS